MVITFEESNPYLILRALFTVVASLAMMASLTEFRFPRKKLLKVLALYLCWVVLSNAVLLPLLGIARVLQIFLFTVTIPAVLLTYWAAKDSPAQAIFNYASQCVFPCCWRRPSTWWWHASACPCGRICCCAAACTCP